MKLKVKPESGKCTSIKIDAKTWAVLRDLSTKTRFSQHELAALDINEFAKNLEVEP